MLKEFAPTPIPSYDRFARTCHDLNKTFRPLDPLEVNEALESLRATLGAQEPLSAGLVYVSSDSTMYDFFSQAEGTSSSQVLPVLEVAEELTEGLGVIFEDEFYDEVGHEVSELQQRLDSSNPIDVLVKISHVYESEYLKILDEVCALVAQLGGKILSEEAISPLNQRILRMQSQALPYNYTGGVVVRFEK